MPPGGEPGRIQALGVKLQLSVSYEMRSDTRYRWRIAKSEQSRDGLSAVLADHSTDGQRNMAGL